MTDRELLFTYRLSQAEETLADARKMRQNNLSPRSIINRAYYAVFYALLALFLKAEMNLKTSKHAGIIGIFDKEFVHAGKIDRRYSKILHKLFEARQVGDYKEFAEISAEEAAELVMRAEEFIQEIKGVITK